MLILVLAANTGFADFPRLASFQAGDSFLPRQLTKRGHRLVYSNGIMVLAGAAMVLVVITGAEVTAAHPSLRHRGVHRLHALAGRHDQAPPASARAGLEEGPGHQRLRCLPLGGRGAGHRHHEVRRRGLGHPRAAAAARGLPPAAEPAVRPRGRAARGRRARGRHRTDPPAPRGARVHGPPRPGRGPSDPVRPRRSHPTSCGRCTSPSTSRRPTSWRPSGAGSGCSGCRSSWSGAPTVASPVPRWRPWRPRWPTVDRGQRPAPGPQVPRACGTGILHDRTADSILAEVSRLPHANVTTVPFHFDSIDDPKVAVAAVAGRSPGSSDAAGSPSAETVPGTRCHQGRIRGRLGRRVHTHRHGALPGPGAGGRTSQCHPRRSTARRARPRAGGRRRHRHDVRSVLRPSLAGRRPHRPATSDRRHGEHPPEPLGGAQPALRAPALARLRIEEEVEQQRAGIDVGGAMSEGCLERWLRLPRPGVAAVVDDVEHGLGVAVVPRPYLHLGRDAFLRVLRVRSRCARPSWPSLRRRRWVRRCQPAGRPCRSSGWRWRPSSDLRLRTGRSGRVHRGRR